MNQLRAAIAAIYARYSCDQQRETSLDDQIRRCRELALQHGLTVNDELIFTDSALSGQDYAQDKREGYQAFLAAWDSGKFDVILVDEFARLSRDDVEQAILRRRLRQNRRVRMITADGTDTAQPEWELSLAVKGVISQQEIRSIRHRLGRGMVGQLERGYMIACPAFGYDYKRELDSEGNRIGTHWVINETEAALVREIYFRRENGQSMHQIAAWLNESGVPCCRKAKATDGGYWRPSRIRNLLANPIYRGVFVWHGSAAFRKRVEREGLEGPEFEERVFARPALRLVTDETWIRCNTKKVRRAGYGGGKNALAGLITCGCCEATLVLSSQKRCRSVYCASCTVAKGTNGQDHRLSVTVAAAGVQILLSHALQYFLTPAFVEAFRSSLREKLTGDNTREIGERTAELTKLQRAQERLSHLLGNDEEDEVLAARYKEAKQRVREAQTRLDALIAGNARIDRTAIEAQLQVDPATLVAGVFDAGLPPERLRSVLARLFPSIVLDGKDGRYTSFFRIAFAPGVALSMASQTEMVDEGSIELRFQLRYIPDNRSDRRESRWSVIPLEERKANTSTISFAEKSITPLPVIDARARGIETACLA